METNNYSLWENRITQAFNVIKKLYDAYDSSEDGKVKGLLNEYEFIKNECFIQFSDFKEEISTALGSERFVKLEKFDEMLKELEDYTLEPPLYADILKSEQKEFTHLLKALHYQIVIQALLFRCAWVCQLTGISISEFQKQFAVLKTLKEYSFYHKFARNCIKHNTFELILKQVTLGIQEESKLRISFCIYLLNKIVSRDTHIASFSHNLQKEVRKVSINGQNDDGKTLAEAKETMKKLLEKGVGGIPKILKLFEFLNSNENKIKEFNENFLTEKVSEEKSTKLLEELDYLFPREVIFFPIRHADGMTLMDGGILLDSSVYSEPKEKVATVRVLLVILQELAHKKKMLQLAKNNFACETLSFAKNFYTDMEELSTGSLLKTKGFGGIFDIYNVDEAIADQILASEGLNSEKWEKIAEALMKENNESFGEKFSRKSLRKISKCGTTSFRKKIIESVDLFEEMKKIWESEKK